MEGGGSLEDLVSTHMNRPKWLRLGLMRMASKSTWGHVLDWIGAKFSQMIPFMMLYFPVKFCGNPIVVQRLETVLVYGFRGYLGAHAASNYYTIQPISPLCVLIPLCKIS